MTSDGYTVIAACIMVLPGLLGQLIAITQNRRIESKVDTVDGKVVGVDDKVNGALDKAVDIATKAGIKTGLAEGRAEKR